MKIITLILAFFVISLSPLYAQQFSLYNSRTLYDVFENPSQSAYQIDTSRRIAFNFFIPTITVNGAVSGSAGPAIKSLVYNGVFNGRDIPIGQNKFSTVTFNTNTYIAMLRLLTTVNKSQEIGASWQIRDEGRVKVTNETLAIFDNYNLFTEIGYQGFFNNEGRNQSYHQFSLTYRQDYSKRLSLGIKGSLLSGISYTSFKVGRSELNIDQGKDIIDVSITGGLRSSSKFDEFNRSSLYPFFKNPGLSLTAGASYKFRNGWFVMGTLKDIGFIKWSKESYLYQLDGRNITINEASNSTADNRLADELAKRMRNSYSRKSYLSALAGKIEILVNKDYGNYQPNLIISKSLYYDSGDDIVLTNNYHHRNLVFTASADYNTNKYLAIGGQFMVKSPNTEFFIGSDHLLKTFETIRGIDNGTPPYSDGYTGASFYMGFGLKFGRVLEHPANANYIPGFGRGSGGGFLKRLFRKRG